MKWSNEKNNAAAPAEVVARTLQSYINSYNNTNTLPMVAKDGTA
jgi:hypothetical protein